MSNGGNNNDKGGTVPIVSKTVSNTNNAAPRQQLAVLFPLYIRSWRKVTLWTMYRV